ncbi:MAG: ribosome recycling factor [Candidatus Promineifilaceae bacterium]|nr:ribosome recycling factor [Candidatus Promineifilaceae bacterium]
MIRELLQETESRMLTAVHSLEMDLAAFRTGRASPHLLDRVTVEAYGSEMALNQVALVSVPEPQQLAIRPYDVNILTEIERAILKSDIGITPSNDGKIIRLTMPRLTEERRRELSKQVGRRVEEAKVAVRNIRRDALNDLREFKEENLLAEDAFYRGQDDLQKLTDRYIEQVEEMGQRKEAEIMEI